MSMLSLQTAIARFCLSREFRKALKADVETAVADLSMSDGETTALKQLDLEVVGEFGDKLIQKRISMVRKWLPQTFSALDHRLTIEMRF